MLGDDNRRNVYVRDSDDGGARRAAGNTRTLVLAAGRRSMMRRDVGGLRRGSQVALVRPGVAHWNAVVRRA
jgi:hypothetical protein